MQLQRHVRSAVVYALLLMGFFFLLTSVYAIAYGQTTLVAPVAAFVAFVSAVLIARWL